MQKGFAVVYVLVGVLVLSLVVGGAYYFGKLPIKFPNNTTKACTEEAKQCPDGSFVGRTGPNCEFQPCPPATSKPSDETANWKTYTNDIFGYSLKYPTDNLEACTGTPFALENIEEFANQQPEVIKNLRTKFQKRECLPPLGGLGYSIEVWVRVGGPESVQEIEALYKRQGVKIDKITVDGTVGVLVTGRKSNPPSSLDNTLPDNFKEITIYKNGKIYSLHLNRLKYENIFDQILSTFKFTN